MDELGPVPAGMTKFNREAKIPRQLFEKFSKRRFSLPWRKRRWKLDQNDLELWRERLDCAKEQIYLSATVAQPAGMRDLARELASETKAGRCYLDPAANGVFRGSTIKG
jgi:hypothetical protein